MSKEDIIAQELNKIAKQNEEIIKNQEQVIQKQRRDDEDPYYTNYYKRRSEIGILS
ncbi:hypothetical protein PP175_26275 (plasmid) [Aneurinibacillus sp. Ricciae_BoGa-3]|uniref:hypothetical protein n=1 Tax=Aneurinibacillus sp. Ricciae_BoGa-3 TaxID=3022697 RepID=UPI0023403BE1|nr:hypothetical protein [Aneurinibacillus sp. Ricciae_BoGa-3]WCK57574.1 hypothetical protein PP175_26275 [Aneurinibacillus sp. Ricciae_BoGa-3]